MRFAWLAIVLAFVALTACEDDDSKPDGAGGAPPAQASTSIGASSSSSVGASSSTGSLNGPCPSRLPGDGEPCNPTNTLCTYGESTFPYCRDRAWCQFDGWNVSTAEPTCDVIDAACPDPGVTPEPHTTCPMEGLLCAFSDGTQCSCTFCDFGLPCGAPGPRWACGTPGFACPLTPPNAGESCSMPMLICSYGYTCEDGIVATCDPSGFWTWQEGCPVG